MAVALTSMGPGYNEKDFGCKNRKIDKCSPAHPTPFI